jgi:hypothetical protein
MSLEPTQLLTLKPQAGRPPQTVLLRPVEAHEAPAVLALQALSIGNLMFPLSESQIQDLLAGGQGCILGVWLGQELIAFLAITLPGLSEHNLGRDAGLPEDLLPGVAQWTAVVVHPDHRGSRLFHHLLRYTLERLQWTQVRRWLCVVRCENEFSLRVVLSTGARVLKTIRKYDGHERFLLMLELP